MAFASLHEMPGKAACSCGLTRFSCSDTSSTRLAAASTVFWSDRQFGPPELTCSIAIRALSTARSIVRRSRSSIEDNLVADGMFRCLGAHANCRHHVDIAIEQAFQLLA